MVQKPIKLPPETPPDSTKNVILSSQNNRKPPFTLSTKFPFI